MSWDEELRPLGKHGDHEGPLSTSSATGEAVKAADGGPPVTRISAIIPTWREAKTIAAAVRAARDVADEVLVADAGSPDGTAERAEAAGARVLRCPKGRGPQLDAGAKAATGDVLLFLHADTSLPHGARSAILEALENPAVPGGNFLLQFEPIESWVGRVFTSLYDVRRRWLRIYYGDSAVFVRRSVYTELGGFRPLPILEDYEFFRRLERHGRTAYVRDRPAVTSGRRYQGRVLQTLGTWALIQGLYTLGVSPHRLARLYSDIR